MQFEWDPNKNESNLAKHGISFAAAARVFDDPHFIDMESSKLEHGESRSKAIGVVESQLFTVVYTDRGERRRIISARRSRVNERRQYDQGREGG